MCMDMKTIDTPNAKFNVNAWPNKAADISPVKIVAIVDEYFFKIVSANLKKNDDSIPCMALLTTRSHAIPLNPLMIPPDGIEPTEIAKINPKRLKQAP